MRKADKGRREAVASATVCPTKSSVPALNTSANGGQTADRKAVASSGRGAASAVDLQLVCFMVGGREYGIAIKRVLEIMRMGRLTPPVDSADFVAGGIRLKEKNWPVIDLGLRLGYEAAAYGAAARIIVTEHKGDLLGLIAGEVTEVLRVASASMDRVEQDTQDADSHYVMSLCRLDDRVIRILDPDTIAAF